MHECIEKFQEILEKDLKEKINKVNAAGTVNPDDLMVIDKATDVMLDLIKYDNWLMGGGEMSHDDGNYSYRRGRNAATGRYVSMDSYPRMPVRRSYGDSYMDGYSGHNRMIDELEKMYDETHDDRERRMISGWIAEMNR